MCYMWLRAHNQLRNGGRKEKKKGKSPQLGGEEGKPPSPDLLHDIHNSFSIPKMSERKEDPSDSKDIKIQLLHDKIPAMEEKLKLEEQRSEDQIQAEKEFEVRIGNTLDIIDSFEKKLTLEVPAKEQIEEKLKDYKGQLNAIEDAISEMVDEREKLQEELDELALIFQERIKELKVKLPTETILVAQISVDLSDPRSDIKTLRVKLKKTKNQLNKEVELGFQLANYRTPSWYLVEKNLIVEAFRTRALVLDEISFLVNMVMGSVHIRALCRYCRRNNEELLGSNVSTSHLVTGNFWSLECSILPSQSVTDFLPPSRRKLTNSQFGNLWMIAQKRLPWGKDWRMQGGEKPLSWVLLWRAMSMDNFMVLSALVFVAIFGPSKW
eukprot:Gb_06389 [translate_table: standard]